MAQDVVRFFLILVSINILMGFVQMYAAYNTQPDEYGYGDLSLAEEIKSNLNDQMNSNATMPENYQTQTSAASEQGMGRGVILKLIAQGLNPFPQPEGGWETDVEKAIMYTIGTIRFIIYLIIGIMAFLIFFNKKT